MQGVALADGTEIRAQRVASGVDANVTFLKLMEDGDLPAEFVEAVRNIDYASASCKINVALSELPDFTAVPGTAPGPQHRGTIHISPTMEYIERAYDDAKYGRPSAQPIIEATIPSVLDDTLAPPGKYVMSMFTQYFPYKLAPGLSLEAEKEKYADRCFDLMNQFAPNFKRSVIARRSCRRWISSSGSGSRAGTSCRGSCRSAACRSCGRCRGTRTTGRRCAGSTVRGGDASGRRGDGRVRLQRGAGDRASDLREGEMVGGHPGWRLLRAQVARTISRAAL